VTPFVVVRPTPFVVVATSQVIKEGKSTKGAFVPGRGPPGPAAARPSHTGHAPAPEHNTRAKKQQTRNTHDGSRVFWATASASVSTSSGALPRHNKHTSAGIFPATLPRLSARFSPCGARVPRGSVVSACGFASPNACARPASPGTRISDGRTEAGGCRGVREAYSATRSAVLSDMPAQVRLPVARRQAREVQPALAVAGPCGVPVRAAHEAKLPAIQKKAGSI